MATEQALRTDAARPLTTEEVLAAEARAIHGDAAGRRVKDKIPPEIPPIASTARRRPSSIGN